MGTQYSSVLTQLNKMTKDYQLEKITMDAIAKSTYAFDKIKKVSWSGVGGVNSGRYQVPTQTAQETTVQVGSLEVAGNIHQGKYEKGYEDTSAEMWGALKFHEKELREHRNLDQAWEKLIGNKVEQISDLMATRLEHQFLNGGAISRMIPDPATGAIVAGTAGGQFFVERPERFAIGEKLEVLSDTQLPLEVYVFSINMNTNELVCSTNRLTLVPVNLSAFTVADNARIAVSGITNEPFLNLEHFLLPAGIGAGSNTIHNVLKSSAPIYQSQIFDAMNINGVAMNDVNALSLLYKIYYRVKMQGKVKQPEILVPLGLFAVIAESAQTYKDYSDKNGDITTAGYGFSSIKLTGPYGDMKVTALESLPHDKAYIIDFSTFRFAGRDILNDGRELGARDWHDVRTAQGYEYIKDICLVGKFICTHASKNAVIYNIPEFLY